MKKRILSMLLAMVMLICTVPVYANSENGETVVYLSMSRYGELVESKDGETMAYVPVTLSGKESYNLDDCFREAHILYHPEGESGYASEVSEWGLGIGMLWGDTSYNFGYQINGGKESVMGLEHQVKNGDMIDACIYRNLYPDTEGYSYFDIQKKEVQSQENITLTLYSASGYDEDWNTIYSLCEGAGILVNGEETDYLTDENGQVTLCFDEPGVYVISAKKNKMLGEESVPAITAPVCLVTVSKEKEELIHSIAAMYSESNFSLAGGNLPWIIADLAVYEELYGENILSEEKKAEALGLITDFAEVSEKPGDLAKSILAVRALGYDARRIFTKNYKHIDLVGKLKALAENDDSAVTNIYTLPYVIIALGQTDSAMTDSLVAAALEKKEKWQELSFGTDAITPMIAALAPYAEENPEVSAVIEESLEIVKGEMRDDGLIDGAEGYEAASTALAIWAFSEAGIDSTEVVSGEKSLIDGLLSVQNEEGNGFTNAFATEQGFRSLLGWHMLTEQNKREIYNFSDNEEKEINLTGAAFCPVVFEIFPDDAEISIENGETVGDNIYDFPSGEYEVTVTAPHYREKTEKFVVSEEEAENHILKTVKISLKKESSGGGGGGGSSPSAKEEKKEPEKEAEKPIEEEKTQADISEIFADVTPEAWYSDSVRYVYEKGLFTGTDKGFEPDSFMTRAMLVTVLHRMENGMAASKKHAFSDVPDGSWYSDGVSWAAENGIVTGMSNESFAPDENITREQLAVILYRYALYCGTEIEEKNETRFNDSDSISSYAKDAVGFASYTGIMGGKGNNMLFPRDSATRAEVATMLMRFAEVVKSR